MYINHSPFYQSPSDGHFGHVQSYYHSHSTTNNRVLHHHSDDIRAYTCRMNSQDGITSSMGKCICNSEDYCQIALHGGSNQLTPLSTTYWWESLFLQSPENKVHSQTWIPAKLMWKKLMSQGSINMQFLLIMSERVYPFTTVYYFLFYSFPPYSFFPSFCLCGASFVPLFLVS